MFLEIITDEREFLYKSTKIQSLRNSEESVGEMWAVSRRVRKKNYYGEVWQRLFLIRRASILASGHR